MREERIPTAPQLEVVPEQARKVRALYPELFAALDRRDQRLQRALYRIPHPHDPEALVSPQTMEQALLSLHKLDSGISKLCDEGD